MQPSVHGPIIEVTWHVGRVSRRRRVGGHRSALRKSVPRSASSMRGTTLIALDEVVQKFRYRIDSANQQMIPGAGAGDVEQVALGVIDLLQIGWRLAPPRAGLFLKVAYGAPVDRVPSMILLPNSMALRTASSRDLNLLCP